MADIEQQSGRVDRSSEVVPGWESLAEGQHYLVDGQEPPIPAVDEVMAASQEIEQPDALVGTPWERQDTAQGASAAPQPEVLRLTDEGLVPLVPSDDIQVV